MSAMVTSFDRVTAAFNLLVGYARDGDSIIDAVQAGATLPVCAFSRFCRLCRTEVEHLLRMENYWRQQQDGDECEQYRCTRHAFQECLKLIHDKRRQWTVAAAERFERVTR